LTEKSRDEKDNRPIIHWFLFAGVNWSRAALGVYLVFDQDNHEYAIAFLIGPFCIMFGIEEDPAKRHEPL